MKVVDVSLQNLKVWEYLRESTKNNFFMIQCSWDNSREYRQRLVDGIRECEKEGVEVLQAVTCFGGDDVEDFVFQWLPKDFKAFPAFIRLQPPKVPLTGKLTPFWYDLTLRNRQKRNFTDVIENVGVLFVGGDRSSVGKTSCCLGILSWLLQVGGFKPSDLGYIKPVTQCEAEQPITKFCGKEGIECIGVGPVVFYKGFTRAFLAGETSSSESLLADTVSAVNDIKRRRKIVLVDGVGYPAVGSICGLSNAHVAAALRAPVLLIGKSGVGDAVDSHNLNSTFFEYHGAHVLGAIFNKVATEGYYSLASVKQSVDQYFTQYRTDQRVYGYLPNIELLDEMKTTAKVNCKPEEQLFQAFNSDPAEGKGGVLMKALLADILLHNQAQEGGLDAGMYIGRVLNQSHRAPFSITSRTTSTHSRVHAAHAAQKKRPRKRGPAPFSNDVAEGIQVRTSGLSWESDSFSGVSAKRNKVGSSTKSRAEIEAEARSMGAAGG